MANLLARKPLEQLMSEAQETGEHSLKRALGPLNLVTLGIGAIIGAGIFVITGQAAAQFAGPAIIISFVLAGTACAFAGLCYSEFASMIPIAGSAYTYSYATLGELVAWIIGWDLILEYAFGAATVAVGWSGHLRAFMHDIGLNMPAMPTSNFVLFGLPIHLKYDYVGFLIIMVITTILVIGIKESANFTTGIVILKVAVVCMFIGLATAFLVSHGWKPNYWHPLILRTPAPARVRVVWHSPRRGRRLLCIYRFRCGFYRGTGSQKSQERYAARNSRVAGHLHYSLHPGFRPSYPSGALHAIERSRSCRDWHPHYRASVGDISGRVGGSRRAGYGDAGHVTWTVAGVVFHVARWAALALGQQGASPISHSVPELDCGRYFRRHTPTLVPLSILDEMTSVGTLLAFVLVSAGVWVMRKSHPHVNRPFKTPMVPLVPILAILFSSVW